MPIQSTRGWRWRGTLLVWLGCLLALLGTTQGQERPMPPAQPAAALAEARQLDEQIRKLYSAGNSPAAIPLAQQALALRQQVLGSTHPSVLVTLNNLAALYKESGAYEQAEPLYQRALTLRQQVLGPTHPDVAISLNNLALLYQAQGAYGQAESMMQRALAIAEQVLDPMHPTVAIFLDNLAALSRHRQTYQQAELLYQRALSILEQRLGPTHPEVAHTLNNLAALYQEQGAYEQAEPLLRRALALRQQGLDPQHPAIATSLNNLALLYRDRGAYTQAEPLLRQALELRQQGLDPQHPAIATSLNNLAALYHEQGDLTQAEPLLQRVLAMLVQRLGPTHPYVATALNNLALVSQHQGAYAQAEALYHKALALRRQVLGPTHPALATLLNNLAALYQEQGASAQAEPLLLQALTLQEQSLGPMHPHVAATLNNLALLYEAQGAVGKAINLRQRRHELSEQLLVRLLGLGSEAEKRAYLATLAGETWATVSLHTQSAPHQPEALRLALTTVLRRKGRVLEAMTATLAILRRHLGPAEQRLLERWAAAQTQLTTQMLRSAGAPAPETDGPQRARLEAQVQELEAQLSTRSAEFRTQTTPVTLTDIQQAIPTEAALIELVWYRSFQPHAARAVERWGAARYVAYVLHRQGAPQWVDLGEAAQIDSAVVRLRRELACANTMQGLAQETEPARQRCLARLPQLQTYARQLDDQIMRPLRPLLGNARLILLVPDGTLNLLPFGALVDEQQHFLAERFTFNYLTTGRDLIRLQTKYPSQQGPLVLANPAFDTDSPASPLQLAALQSRALSPRSADLANMRFEPLQGTADEAQALQALLPGIRVLSGAAATEAALKQGHGPLLLHVATHGFFLADQPGIAQHEAMPLGTPLEGMAPRLWAEHPLLRSGLALAGANTRQSGIEDGVLTALEATGLDLSGTQLVVLSACETGVGEVHNGEGVYGLRRALVMAGAESQVMSLWKIEDEATRQLMETYYTRLLAGEERAEALRQAQLAMLTGTEQRHPFFWAGFIASGEWRPLTGLRLPQK